MKIEKIAKEKNKVKNMAHHKRNGNKNLSSMGSASSSNNCDSKDDNPEVR